MKLIVKIAAVIIFGVVLWNLFLGGRDQVQVPDQELEEQSQVQEESWTEINTRATGLYQEQKFMKAAGAGRQALAVARKLPETEREKVAISLGNMAMIYTHLGKFAEAEEHAKEELTIRESIFGKEDLEVLKAWNHLAIVYTMAQAPDDAERSLKTIIALEEQKFGPESPEVIASLKRLGKFYNISRNEKKAEELAERIEKISSAQQ